MLEADKEGKKFYLDIKKKSINAINEALESGINFIDTVPLRYDTKLFK